MKIENSTQVPAGYKSLAGNLPPFVSMEIGQTLHGQIFRHREITKVEKVKVKGGKTEEVEKTQHYIDLTLIEGGEFNTGTIKRPSSRKFEKGESVTLSMSAGIFNPLIKELYIESGKSADYWPAEGEAAPVVNWESLNGRSLFIRREKDGTVKKGPYTGNKRNSYTVALSPK